MKVIQAFPKIFSRSTPIIDGNAPLLDAARILTALQVSAVMVLDRSDPKFPSQYKAVTGYSILSKLPLKEGDISEFFAKPSKDSALSIRVVKESDPIEAVVDAIEESRVGVVLVAGENKSSEVLTTAELRDFIRLYRDGADLAESSIKIGTLTTSPVLSVKKQSNLEDVIRSMLKYRVRRILVAETKALISDRDVLSFITSPRIIERMEKSAEMVLKTPVSELPSTQPPRVDSRMTIVEAAGLMNPDSGDCVICDNGIVTFWDLVVKLEESKKAGILLQEGSSSSDSPNLSQHRNLRESREAALKGMSKFERKRFSALSRKIRERGFISVDDVPRLDRRKVVDPIYFKQPVRPFNLIGVCSGRKGAIQFSAVNLFGLRRLDESYYVLDWERFSKFISQKLEVMFRSANAAPSRGMKVAFTRFMHNLGLHWTGCGHMKETRKRLVSKGIS